MLRRHLSLHEVTPGTAWCLCGRTGHHALTVIESQGGTRPHATSSSHHVHVPSAGYRPGTPGLYQRRTAMGPHGRRFFWSEAVFANPAAGWPGASAPAQKPSEFVVLHDSPSQIPAGSRGESMADSVLPHPTTSPTVLPHPTCRSYRRKWAVGTLHAHRVDRYAVSNRTGRPHPHAGQNYLQIPCPAAILRPGTASARNG